MARLWCALHAPASNPITSQPRRSNASIEIDLQCSAQVWPRSNASHHLKPYTVHHTNIATHSKEMATTTKDPLLRPLLHWLNSLPAAGPRCLLAASADDVLADEGRALRDLIGPPSSGLTLAQALEALVGKPLGFNWINMRRSTPMYLLTSSKYRPPQARRRPQAFERHVRPSLVQADGRAAAWDPTELAARVLREAGGGGGGGGGRRCLLLPALLRGLRRVVDKEEEGGEWGGAAAPLGGARPPPHSPPPAAAAAVAVPAAASHSNPSSPCRRLRPAYHRSGTGGDNHEEDRSGAAHPSFDAPAPRSPARSLSPPPVRQRRRRQRQQQQPQPPSQPPRELTPPAPVITMAQKRAAVRAWLAALGLHLPLPPQEGGGHHLHGGRATRCGTVASSAGCLRCWSRPSRRTPRYVSIGWFRFGSSVALSLIP